MVVMKGLNAVSQAMALFYLLEFINLQILIHAESQVKHQKACRRFHP